MSGIQQKFKLMKFYELLKQETDEDHPISRRELCRRLNEMGISSNVRTLSIDIEDRKCGFSEEKTVVEYSDGPAVRYNCVLYK